MADHRTDADLVNSFYGFPAHSLTGATLTGVRQSVLKVGNIMVERLEALLNNRNAADQDYCAWLEGNVYRYTEDEYDALPRTAVVHRVLYDVQESEAEAVAVILRTCASGVDLVEIDDRRFVDLDAQPLGYEYVEVPYDSLRYTTVLAGTRRRILNASNFFKVMGGAGLDIDGLCHPEIWVAPWLFQERNFAPPPARQSASSGQSDQVETTNRRAVFWERRASERGESMVMGLLLACRRPLQDDNEQQPAAFEHTVCSAVCRGDGVIFVLVPELPPPAAEGHLFLVDTTLHAAVWPCVKQLMDGTAGQFPDRISQLKSPWIRYFHRTDFAVKNHHELSNRIPKMCALMTRTRGTSILPLVVGVEVARAISAFLISHERNLAHKRREIVMAARRQAAIKAGRNPARVRRDIAPLHMNLPSVRATPENESLSMLAQALAACSVCQTITFSRSLELCKKSRRELRAEAKAQFAATPEDVCVSPLLRPEDVDSHEEDTEEEEGGEDDDEDGASSSDEQVCVLCPSDSASGNGDRYKRSSTDAWPRKNGRRVIFSATQTYGCADCGACFCSLGCMQSSDHVCAVFRALPRKLTQPRVVLEAEQKKSEKNAARQRAKRENRRRRKYADGVGGGVGGGADGAYGEDGEAASETTDARAARARNEAARRNMQAERADMDRTATEVALKLAEARASRAQNIANCVKAEIVQRQKALDAGEAWHDAETKARWAAIVKKINLLPNPMAFEGAIALLNGATQGQKDCLEAPAAAPTTHSTLPRAEVGDKGGAGGSRSATTAVATHKGTGRDATSFAASASAINTSASALDALSCVHPLWQGTRECGPRRGGATPLRSDQSAFCSEGDADDDAGSDCGAGGDRAVACDERMVAALRRRRLVRESLERECTQATSSSASSASSASTASSASARARCHARGRGNAVQRLRQQLPMLPPPPPTPPPPPPLPPPRPTQNVR